MKTKQLFFFGFFCLLFSFLKSQPTSQPPTNNSPSGAASGFNDKQFWSRAGNTLLQGSNNMFGTLWNSPIYTETNGITRTRLNGTLTTPINTINQVVDGYFGIGPNGFFNTNSPWSMLHLEGPNNTNFGGAGWRSWMKTGAFMKENSDAMYVGLKNEVATGGANRSDAIINWSDDAYTGAGAVDVLRFIFTASANGNGNGGGPLDGKGLNGYEFMRMASFPSILNSANFAVGHVGIGPLFTQAAPPQNRLHMNSEDWLDNYFQITSTQATGQTGADGTKFGIMNVPIAVSTHVLQSGNAFIYNQEDRHILFGTGHATPSSMTATKERMRVTHVGAPTNLPGGSYGIFNPFPQFLTNDVTRVSISYDPGAPVDRPMSLFHIGYNTSNSFDGWRNWMEVGTFTGGDGSGAMMYSGVNSGNILAADAVINWGYKPSSQSNGTTGTRMRFIFTTVNFGALVSASQKGLEAAHFWSDGNNPRMGVGDMQTANTDPLNTLEIMSSPSSPYFGSTNGSSGLKFRNMSTASTPVNNPGLGVCALDNAGNLIYVKGGGGGIGNYCINPYNPLTGNYIIPLNGYNINFSSNIGGATLGGNVNIGDLSSGNPCGLNVARLYVRNSISPAVPKGIYSLQGSGIAIHGQVNSIGGTNYAGQFDGTVFINGGSTGTGAALVSDSVFKTNIRPIENPISTIKQLKPKSFYFDTTNSMGFNFSSKKQYGFLAQNVNQVYPELVSQITKPASCDTSGEPIPGTSPTFSALNYNAFFGLLTAGMQQQQLSIDSLRNTPPGSVGADNGLTVNSGTVQLGGSLLQDTKITDNANAYYLGVVKGNVWGWLLQPNGTIYQNPSPATTAGYGQSIDATNVSYGLSVVNTNTISSFPTNSAGIFANNVLNLPTESAAFSANAKNTNSSGYAVGFTSNISQGSNNQYGFYGACQGGVAANNLNCVVYGRAAEGINNYGAIFDVASSNASTQDMVGVKVSLTGVTGSARNIGIYSTVNGTSSNGTVNNYAGLFNGDVNVNGQYFQNGSSFTSDRNLKTNIDSISNAGDIVKQLKPVTFYFDTNNTRGLNFSGKKQYGLIAQDVQTVLPELVSNFIKGADTDSAGNIIHAATNYKTLNYNAFISILIKNAQEQQAQIDSMKTILASCCASSNARTTQNNNTAINVELSDADIVVLNQNTPNPFAEQTSITYTIPKNTSAAQILFYDINGRQIKAVDVTKKGKGQLNVYANDLTNGVYSYTLIVDGKIIDTKKMVKQQ